MVAVLKANEAVHHFSEELLSLLSVINLVMSPSGSVKEVASHVLLLSGFSSLVLELPASCSSEQQVFSMVHRIGEHTFILPRFESVEEQYIGDFCPLNCCYAILTM